MVHKLANQRSFDAIDNDAVRDIGRNRTVARFVPGAAIRAVDMVRFEVANLNCHVAITRKDEETFDVGRPHSAA